MPPTAPASITAEASLGSKSISSHWAHERGLKAEERVADYFLQKKFRILHRRYRTAYSEIDLIVESPRHEIFLLEVKTLNSFDFLENRVSARQKERLKRALIFVQARTKKPVRLILVFVNAQGKLLFIDNF